MQYPFVVQEAGGAHGITEPAQNYQWRDVSQHTSLSAARRRVRREYQEMHDRCGSAAWDNHYQIIARQDTPMRATFCCLGIGAGLLHQCSAMADAIDRRCAHSAIVNYLWPANEPEPVPDPPAGWTRTQCPHCARAERELLDLEFDEHHAERLAECEARD